MIVGLIANPMSSKDVRRLTGLARVVDVEEKANLVARLLVGLAVRPGIEVHALADVSGLVERAVRVARGRAAPVRYLDVEAEGDESDTRRAAGLLRGLEARALVTVGGDGTVRAAVEGWPDAPLVPLAAGTNNAIALVDEPTVVGTAVAACADPAVAAASFHQVPRLAVSTDDGDATAVVDAVGVRTAWTGARALWQPEELLEAVVTRAAPTAVGVASVAAAFGPLPPDTARHLRFGPGRAVKVVFGPGLVTDVEVADHETVPLGTSLHLDPAARVVAVDGERRLVTHRPGTVTVAAGPSIFDPAAALAASHS